ncbi:4-hydroxy-tetrahydrodipicolinate reductase [Acidiferrimicrobium sp. IK]|uniref:4-hydroxy-tetrahydrodipicolinate reductase n=1 Tax=Acidiferrimicrobium sp. IK TaxID=2871700 RepID=UPI0021CB8D25|nr:4-hydroxy-tetrahydrodipicolinate reductase [Acidiferrimicrobium sp. IK]MCU4183735.1 4-hydroxy-tetrahydrodipicolinate reductase [Acidiferrimicrobium sp. IK]
MINVAVIGAGGRMGSAVCAAVDADAALHLVAAIDPARDGTEVPGERDTTLRYSAEVDAAVAAGADVAVDFTTPDAVAANARFCAGHGLHLVIGTTGLGAAGEQELAHLYPSTGPLGCILAANFAIGAVLSMRFAELAAPWFETAEIIELHHDRKVDAPSGTALRTAERMAAASGEWAADPTRSETVAGARGGQGPGGIRIHSVRLRGLVAHQEVLLGTTGETLTIRHDSLDRSSFMPGVVLALKAVAARPGLTVGIDPLLGL